MSDNERASATVRTLLVAGAANLGVALAKAIAGHHRARGRRGASR